MNVTECKKIAKKKAKLVRLAESEGIKISESPTRHVLIWNVGLMTGASREVLLSQFANDGPTPRRISLFPKKQYSFLSFSSVAEAELAIHRFQGEPIMLLGIPVKMKLAYVENVPVDEIVSTNSLPPGLKLREEYIDGDYEAKLLEFLDVDEVEYDTSMKHRRVKHYGYRFDYKTNGVDEDRLENGIPDLCLPLLNRLVQGGLIQVLPDQLTINVYEPGQGIPPHLDTHTAFEDGIVSLSLNSGTVMDFRHPDGQHCSVLLPPRSIIVMTGESRYLWNHGITPRKTDVVNNPDNSVTLNERKTRVSFTFRKIIQGGTCSCSFPQVCDGQVKNDHNRNVNEIDLEKLYVQQVYEAIASHFDHTRHTPWPRVAQFLQTLPPGSFVVDIGCGNGKYFNLNDSVFEIGFDRSESLMEICRRKGHEVLCGDIMHIPLREGIADACTCIAVVHHLASEERRKEGLENVIKLLRANGRALIYVWAMEQEITGEKSNYIKNCPTDNDSAKPESASHSSSESCSSSLPFPVHVNRTHFEHQDILVPWHLKKGHQVADEAVEKTVHHRYYHLFRKGELEQLCVGNAAVTIENSYYDKGNWCVILRKTCTLRPD